MKSITQKYFFETSDAIIIEKDDLYGKFYINVKNKAKPNVLEIDISQMRDAFSQISNLLNKFDITFFLTFGTCLGAIRENNFIKGDGDIDIGVYSSQKDKFFDFLDALIDNGNFKIYKICVNETNMSIMYKNIIVVDVGFYTKPYKKKYYICSIFKIPAYFLDTLDEIYFIGGGCKCKVPHNPKKYLEKIYGKHWNIPDKNFRHKPSFFKRIVNKILYLYNKIRNILIR